jgi:hypothetical protein
MTPRSAPVCPLTLAAWRLGGLTLSDLWGRYVCLGGGDPQTSLADYLDGAAAWPDMEHNVLAQALNEGLWDVGLPSIAPYRARGAAARDAARETPRPSP